MARQQLTPTLAIAGGVAPATVSGHVDGHQFPNSGQEILIIKNTGAGAHTITVQTPRTVEGLAVAELTNSIAAAGEEVMGPFDPNTYNQGGANEGQVFVDFDASPAELSVRCVKVQRAT